MAYWWLDMSAAWHEDVAARACTTQYMPAAMARACTTQYIPYGTQSLPNPRSPFPGEEGADHEGAPQEDPEEEEGAGRQAGEVTIQGDHAKAD
jgi:hypothetical protein